MLLMGIDPGYGRCGYGVIEQQGQQITLLDYGCIETPADDAFIDRLSFLHEAIDALIAKFNPDKIGVEELFFAKNTTTALKVAHARGVILLCIAKHKVPCLELTPNQIKQSLTGQGNADKRQMQDMVRLMLKLAEIPRPDDAADALAVALAVGVWKRF